MSLSKTLLFEITSKGEIGLQDVYDICDRIGRKHDNASRRLRELMANNLVEPIKNKDGAIIGYIPSQNR